MCWGVRKLEKKAESEEQRGVLILEEECVYIKKGLSE